MLLSAGGGGECPLGRPAREGQRGAQRPEEHDPPERRDAPPDGAQNHGESRLLGDNISFSLVNAKTLKFFE